jgi:tetratricopeptide (TPR) repeat protein
VRVLEDASNIPPDSIDKYKVMAKLNYDMYLADYATTRNNLGATYNKLFKYEEAEKMHLKALKIRRKLGEQYPKQVLPSLNFSLLDLGDLYFNTRRFEQSEEMYLEALRITKNLTIHDPKRYQIEVAILQNKLGNLYLNMKDYSKSEPFYLETLKEYKKRAKKSPKEYKSDVAVVQSNLGLMFLCLKKYDKSESFFTKSMESDPENGDTLYNYACLESTRNNQEKAMELLTKAIEKDKIYIDWAKTDEKLNNVRDIEEFKELVGEASKD